MAITVIRGLLVVTLWVSAAQSQTPQAHVALPSSPATDYSIAANWLCRPGRVDACAQDQTTTVIAADGRLTREPFARKRDPAIDCFYIYPTVSHDPGGNSDLIPGSEELFVVQLQFARFGAQCRTFAPMYRQATLTGLHARMSGGGSSAQPDRALAYADALAAWRYYLAHDNRGRGVVLIGHSQGSAVLTQLIKNEIDGKPPQALLVSAILLGANIVVANGADIGGTFQHIAACRAARQTGCVISYVSFRDDAPPPPDGLFARAIEPLSLQVISDAHALCTNPASLAGGAAPLHSYFPMDFREWAPPGFTWTPAQQQIDTPFVATPGLLSAECVTNGPVTYLAVHVDAGANDVRTHDIPGDVVVDGRSFPDWGLHRVDVPIAIGNLIDIVGQQGSAYVAGRKQRKT